MSAQATTTGGGGRWRVGALVYSGRPDPSWDVEADVAAAWVRRFHDLQPALTAPPDQARLGYRGVWLLAPDGRRWNAFLRLAWSAGDRRLDPGRMLERGLLETAPAGTLPGQWSEWLAPDGGA